MQHDILKKILIISMSILLASEIKYEQQNEQMKQRSEEIYFGDKAFCWNRLEFIS